MARHAVRGEAVQASSRPFAVSDTLRMWLWIDVYESDIIIAGLPLLVTLVVLLVAVVVPIVYAFVHYKRLERRGAL